MTCPRCGTKTDSWPCPNCGFPVMRCVFRRIKKRRTGEYYKALLVLKLNC